jgi:hypothetical protein
VNRRRRLFARFVAVALAGGAGVGAQAARAAEPAPKVAPKVSETASRKDVLLFPSPSELATGLKANGIEVAPIPNLSNEIPTPPWTKIPARQRQLQLGSVFGYLAFGAAASDMGTIAKCFDQVLAGVESIGIEKGSKPYLAIARTRDQIKRNEISQAKVIASLDQLRRDTLLAVQSRLKSGDIVVVLSSAWLRGSSLLARQVKTDAEAAQLAEFVMRPDLIDYIGKLHEEGSKNRADAAKMVAVAKKPKITKSDLTEFVAFADAVLKQP